MDCKLTSQIATGAHASSLKVPAAVHDYVDSVTLVDGLGRIVQVTEKEQLEAVRANLGLLGIVTEINFNAVKAFKVRERQIDLSAQEGKVENIIVDMVRQYEYANLYWFSLNKKAILHAFERVDASSSGAGHRAIWDPQVTSLIPWAYSKLVNVLNGLDVNAMCAFASLRAGILTTNF